MFTRSRTALVLAALALGCGVGGKGTTANPPGEPTPPPAPAPSTPPASPTPPGAGTPTQPPPAPTQPTPPPAPNPPPPAPTNPPAPPPTTPPPSPEPTPPPAGKPMHIYWIDVEGGAATLVVAPSGQTLLHDAGWGDNRGGASRIMPVLTEAGAKQLDYFAASHYHVDHLSGIASLSRAITVANFIDHGMNVEGNDYGYGAAADRGKRTSHEGRSEAGQLGKVEITIISAAGQVTDPLPAAKANPLCQGAQVKNDAADEDPQSLGFLAKFGNFEFVALGDLTWGVEHRMACPMNRIGEIEIFQASQHGSSESNPPQLVHALAPLAVVVNNGANKGGDSSALSVLKRSPGLQGMWQLHRSGGGGANNTEEANIANTGNTNNWLRATIQPDGSFTIFNPRTQMSLSYRSR